MSNWEFAVTSEHKASKDYNCDACEWLQNSLDYLEPMTFAEWREVAKAKRNGWKIKKGQRYLKTTGKYEGEWCTFRAIPAIDAICHKYELYEE